jgi:hypothetical protein
VSFDFSPLWLVAIGTASGSVLFLLTLPHGPFPDLPGVSPRVSVDEDSAEGSDLTGTHWRSLEHILPLFVSLSVPLSFSPPYTDILVLHDSQLHLLTSETTGPHLDPLCYPSL